MSDINAALSWWDVGIFFVGVIFAIYLADRGKSRIMTFVTGMILVCGSGLRHGYIDTRAYRVGFESLQLSEVFNWEFLLNGDSKDRGFSLLSGVITTYFKKRFSIISLGRNQNNKADTKAWRNPFIVSR